jgi:SAM-dependent methyltransferase
VLSNGSCKVGKSKPSYLENVWAAEQQKQTSLYFESSAGRWQEVYQRSDLRSRVYQERCDFALALLDKLKLPRRSPVLEIGCGAGSATVAMAERGYRVQAVDLAAVMADLTRRQAAEVGVDDRVTVSRGDVHGLAFADEAFEVVFALGVLPWVHSLPQAMQEIARVLKPGGYLVASADNRWRLHELLDPLLTPLGAPARRALAAGLRHLGLLKPRATVRADHCSIPEFDRRLAAAGLVKTEGNTVGFGPFSFLGCRPLPDSVSLTVHRKLQSLASRGFPVIRAAGTHYLVLARKVHSSRCEPLDRRLRA